MFIMSKLKIFLLPVFILVLLLPNMMVGQEVETRSQSQSAGGIIDEDLLMFPFYRKYFIKNGTIVAYKIYSKYDYKNHKYGDIDSVKIDNRSYIKTTKNKYIESYVDMNDTIYKLASFRKKHKSKWFKLNNHWFDANYELTPIHIRKWPKCTPN